MNQMKSLINEARSFPPYYQMIDSLNMNLESQKKIAEGLSSFVGLDLSVFFENKPEEFQICIKEFQKAGKKQEEIMQNMVSTQSVIPNSMTVLNTTYKEISNEYSVISNARDVAVKSQVVMDKSIQNLNKLKKQKNVDSVKLEEAEKEVKRTTEKYEADYQAAEDTQKERSQNINELHKKFVEYLAISLKSLAQVRESVAKQLAQVSTELTNSLLFLDQKGEPSFASLEDRLKQLEDEKIE